MGIDGNSHNHAPFEMLETILQSERMILAIMMSKPNDLLELLNETLGELCPGSLIEIEFLAAVVRETWLIGWSKATYLNDPDDGQGLYDSCFQQW